MKYPTLPLLWLLGWVGIVSAGQVVLAQGPPRLPLATQRAVNFQKDIQPILTRACLPCHGPEKQRGGLRLDSRENALKGGNTGIVLKPGDAAHSRLFLIVAGADQEMVMPPKGKQPLTPAELSLVRAWIDQGLRWSGPATIPATTASKHWAFQPIRKPEVPAVANRKWVRNPVDAFILARLEKEKLSPSPEADRITLLRRLSLDLIGLPPTPQEIEAFLGDASPDAYEKLVERLLSSPHYAEKWARHWLDLARYADSDGYEKDTGRPHAWRWRNWVIDAFHRDLPYDQFVLEQLAGDLFPGATTEQKVATGFHRNTLTNKEGGVDREQFRVEAVVDRVNTTTRAFLGLTFNCSQCHDHKYDPFSQREYYEFFAFFNSDVELDILAPLPGGEKDLQKKKAEYEKKLAELQKALADYRANELPLAQEKWEASLTPEQRKALPAMVAQVLKVEPSKRTPAMRKVVTDYHAKIDVRLAELAKNITTYQKTGLRQVMAQTLALGKPRKTNLMIRGDFLRPGVAVQPGVPAVLNPLPADRVGKATRLDLARWVVDPANPLTRRVIVNWVWHKYFGRGLVPTLEDFGTQGEKPSHPELLDYLACELSERKWSLKEFHRLLVTSATYRQSSNQRPELLQRDPLNVVLARQTRMRLDAELIRDAALTASGLLTRTVGGPSVRPPQPSGISELTYAGTLKWVESSGSDRYRRGLYIWFQRTSPFPMLMTFDAPDSNLCCVRREKSNTPLQALTLLNDAVFVECSQALGKRILVEKKGSVAERLRYGFQLCLTREPTAQELARLSRLHEELQSLARADEKEATRLVGSLKVEGATIPETAAWIVLARTLLNLDEFVTRE